MRDSSELRRISVQSASGSYEVLIGSGAFADALDRGSSVLIADRYFASLLSGNSDVPLILVDASEEDKTLSTVERLVAEMRQAGLRRDGHVLAVGGGVVQDVVTLAAQLYMRGVSWSLVPTTLMSMTDSCLGGKSSINVGTMKNLVGGYFPPSTIYIDPMFVDSLQPVDRVCGLMEAVKISYCRGIDTFEEYLRLASRDSHEDLSNLLDTTLVAKRWFIEIDEFDRAERRLLNFGHTFGHALEVSSGFGVKHGVAVGLGILAALSFVECERSLSNAEERLRAYVTETLEPVQGPGGLHGRIDWAMFEQAFAGDKKHRADCFTIVVPSSGRLGAEIRELEPTSASMALVSRAMQHALEGMEP